MKLFRSGPVSRSHYSDLLEICIRFCYIAYIEAHLTLTLHENRMKNKKIYETKIDIQQMRTHFLA